MKRLLLFLILGCCATPVVFGGAKISTDLLLGDPDAVVDVIVQFHTPVTAAHHQKVIDRGGRLKQALEVVQGGLYSMRAGKLEDLAQDHEIVRKVLSTAS